MGSYISFHSRVKEDETKYISEFYDWRQNNVKEIYAPITSEEFDYSSEKWKKRHNKNIK